MQPRNRRHLLLGLAFLALVAVLVVIGGRRPSRDEVVRAKGPPPARAPDKGRAP